MGAVRIPKNVYVIGTRKHQNRENFLTQLGTQAGLPISSIYFAKIFCLGSGIPMDEMDRYIPTFSLKS